MKELEAFKEYVEKDLPASSVVWYENVMYDEYHIRIKCEATGLVHNIRCNAELVKDAVYLRHHYENVRKEFLIERGKAYSSSYISPPKYGKATPSSTYIPTSSTTISTTPWASSGLGKSALWTEEYQDFAIKEMLGETVKPKKPKSKRADYDKVENFGIF